MRTSSLASLAALWVVVVTGCDSASAQIAPPESRSSVAGTWSLSMNAGAQTYVVHLRGIDTALAGSFIGMTNDQSSGVVAGELAGGVLRLSFSYTSQNWYSVKCLLDLAVAPDGNSASGTAYIGEFHNVWNATLTRFAPP